MRNKSRLTVIMIVAFAAVLLAGGLFASNMGFKLNYFLQAGDGGVLSLSGTNTIGLPYNRQVGIDTARDLFLDVLVAGIDGQNIQRFDEPSDSNVIYTFGKADFNLNAGEGYLLKVGVSADYIVVGSHDPSFSVGLIPGDGGATSLSGTQRYAHPYHAVNSTARDLFLALQPEAQNIQRWDKPSDSNEIYTFGKADFALIPGQSYLIKVGSSRSFTPEHY